MFERDRQLPFFFLTTTTTVLNVPELNAIGFLAAAAHNHL